MIFQMKKITAFLTCLFFAAFVNAQTAATASSAATANISAPKADISKVLEFKEENHDFGKIPYGKPVEFDVMIKNIGQDSVKIDNVKVGCGCTTPKYEQGKVYAPGENFKVTLGFTGYADGPFEKYVDIFFNNGLSKQIKFHGTGYKVAETPAPANGALQKLKNSGK
jgi:archaellum component FlaG (FlaF/FlaG flagellin family)